MNNEYWSTLLLGKPRIWFYITVVLFITTGVFLMLDWKQGQSFACVAMIFAGVGWFRSMEANVFGSEAARIRTSWLGYMLLLLAVPTTLAMIDRYPDGSAHGPLAHLWDIGKEMFSKEPPLLIRHERRTEMQGQEKVEFLIITNKSGDGVVPIAATLKDAKHTAPISLPPVFKPYETVEIRFVGKNARVQTETGDVLTIKCEGYGKPLTMKW